MSGVGQPGERASGDRRRDVHLWAVLLVVAVLIVSNLMSNRLLPAELYVPWNVAVAVVMVLVAHNRGFSWADIGVSRATLGRSAVWGLAAFGLVVLAYAVALLIPATRDLFRDARAGDASTAYMLYQVLLRIPLGTVLLEEVAFRGVLPTLLGRHEGQRWRWGPVLGASVLFGLWHVVPSLSVPKANDAVGQVLGGQELLTVLLAVIGTGIAGVVLSWWRYVGRGLLTPMLLHVATNSLGYLAAWLVLRAGW